MFIPNNECITYECIGCLASVLIQFLELAHLTEHMVQDGSSHSLHRRVLKYSKNFTSLLQGRDVPLLILWLLWILWSSSPHQDVVLEVVVGAFVRQLCEPFQLWAELFIEIEQFKAGIFECAELRRKNSRSQRRKWTVEMRSDKSQRFVFNFQLFVTLQNLK